MSRSTNGHIARVAPAALEGKTVYVIGSAHQPHSFTDVRDVARALVTVAGDESAWGRTWHPPTNPARTQEEALRDVGASVGRKIGKVRAIPHLVLVAAGLAVPQLKELRETEYQFARPYVLDSSAVRGAVRHRADAVGRGLPGHRRERARDALTSAPSRDARSRVPGMSASVTSHRAGDPTSGSPRRLLSVLALVAAVAFVTLSMARIAVSGLPLSVVDEHIHLDTAYEVHDGGYPHRGSLMSDAIVQEWACGVGHEAGGTAVPCGDPTLGPDSLPSGRYTSGYIHYPTYFWGGEAFRWLVLPDGGDHGLVDAYRAWSAVVLGLGLLACAAMGLALGLRGAALWAATLLPVAASGTFLLGTVVNPASTAILCGALIAGAGLAWLRRGRGFWWLALATGFASLTAVTDVLPVGAFLLAVLVARLGPRLGLRSAGDGVAAALVAVRGAERAGRRPRPRLGPGHRRAGHRRQRHAVRRVPQLRRLRPGARRGGGAVPAAHAVVRGRAAARPRLRGVGPGPAPARARHPRPGHGAGPRPPRRLRRRARGPPVGRARSGPAGPGAGARPRPAGSSTCWRSAPW